MKNLFKKAIFAALGLYLIFRFKQSDELRKKITGVAAVRG